MRSGRQYLVFTAILCILMLMKFQFTGQSFAQTAEFRGANLRTEDWNPVIAAEANQTYLTVRIDGREYSNLDDGIYMDDERRLMIPSAMIRDAFTCSARIYDKEQLVIEKKDDILEFGLDKNYYIKNKQKQNWGGVTAKKEEQNGMVYVPLEILAQEFGYSWMWDMEKNTLTARNQSPEPENILPYQYDLRQKGRAASVKDQGAFGTCWAFASLTALESALLPETQLQLSVDHMDMNNSFAATAADGGQYTMAMAYLAAWQGPVKEEDDPYGDGKTDASLSAVMHVQDMEIIEAKNLNEIKKAVFQYGGVESCIYTTMQEGGMQSPYYNKETNAYCYLGEEKPNHDVVIIGWDDSFPRESFQTEAAQDGAFICQNSWGDDFGEDGVFYVSYYDTNIGIHNLVFTGVESSSNYDTLYQSDLCGWVGQLGYKKESVYAANVFTARAQEDIAAAGFYTTDKDTSYEVYFVSDFQDTESLNSRMPVAQGKFENAGYHTVKFDQSIRVEGNSKFAVVLYLSTPNAVRPMAIEYAADELTRNVVLDDGEGYISAQGRAWAGVEESSNCNLCIKAYARSVRDRTSVR